MTQVIINDILPLTQAIATGSQTVYSTNWTANYPSDVVVYSRPTNTVADDETQILPYPAAYSVSFIGDELTVQVTLITPSNAGDVVTITRNTPADRENLYTNTNFTPSMLNNDFGILTLVDQQAQLVNQQVGPRYNYSAFIDVPVDTILPILGENQLWAKNNNNTAIIAMNISDIISGGTVTQVNTGLGLTGGPITETGTISLGPISANTFWGNITGSSALPTQVPFSSITTLGTITSGAWQATPIAVPFGGTNKTSFTAYSVICGGTASTSALQNVSGLGTSSQVLTSNGSGALPTWQDNAGGVNPGTTNELAYYASSGSKLSGLATANNGVLITSGGGVPSISSTIPSAVQLNITSLGAQSIALNMNSNPINGVTDPSFPQDAVTLNYLGTQLGLYLPLTGGTMSGIINMGSHKITSLLDPTNPQDAATLAYVTSQTGNYLPLAGGTMSGVIDMGNHQITALTDPSSAQDAVTVNYLGTQLGLYLTLTGGTMSGAINMGSSKITSLLDPTNPQDAVTKAYVDLFAVGLSVQQACFAASTTNLTATYNNGASGVGATLTNSAIPSAFSLDGTSPAVNDRVLVWLQTDPTQNGVYSVTVAGDPLTNWVLTRATDYDSPPEILPGDLVIINNGTTYGGSSFVETATVSAIGTDPILFSQFTFSATSLLLVANNLSDVANTTTAFNNISPLTTKGDLIGFSTQNVRLAVGGSDGQILQVASGNPTGLSWSTAIYPVTTTANQILYSSATNTISGIASGIGGVLVTDISNVPQFLANPLSTGNILQSVNGQIPAWSIPTYPSASGTSGKVLISNGTNVIYSTPTFPNASASAGKFIQSDGTNWIASTPTIPSTGGFNGTILQSNGTNFINTISTYPGTAGPARTIIVSDGTNWNVSTETWATPGVTGNILTSDGTNWTAAPPANSGIVNSGTANEISYYATTGTAVSGLATANSSVLVTSSGGAPSLSTTLPSSLTISSPKIDTIFDQTYNLEVLSIVGQASAVNYIEIINNIITQSPSIASVGTDTNIALSFASKGSGNLNFSANSATVVDMVGVVSAVNSIVFQNNVTTSSPTIYTTGSDTAIYLSLSGKGTGGVRSFGSTDGSLAPSGYISEILNNAAPSVAILSGVPTNIVTLSIPNGTWRVWATINFLPVGAPTNLMGSISSVSNTIQSPSLSSSYVQLQSSALPAGSNQTLSLSPCIVQVSAGPITYHLVGSAAFASTCDAGGFMWAERIY